MDSFTPNPQQLLFLWCVAIAETDTPVKDLPYDLKAGLRKQLEQAGWIEVTKIRRSARSRPMVARLTEEGWYGVERHLGEKISHAAASTRVLRAVLAGLGRVIGGGRLALADLFLAPAPPPTPDLDDIHPPRPAEPTESAQPPEPADSPLVTRIIEVCEQIGGAPTGVRVRLAALRAELTDVPRDLLDQTLTDLERSEQVALYRLDDPREITEDDERASLRNSGGSPRHILYVSRSRPAPTALPN